MDIIKRMINMFKFLLKYHINDSVIFKTKYINRYQQGHIGYDNHVIIISGTSTYQIHDIKHIKLL